MSDIFKEQLVKKQQTNRDTLKKAGIILLALLISITAFFVPVIRNFSVLIIGGIAFGVYYIFSFFSVEYEYVFTNGDLDIDIIYAKSRRKRVFAGNVRDFEIMARADDKNHMGDFAASTEEKDFTSGVPKENTYAFLTMLNGKKTKILFEPNEVILAAISSILTTRRFFR